MELERHAEPIEPDKPTRDFYLHALFCLDEAKVPYLVGGGYAMACYTAIARTTKDLELVLRPESRDRCLQVLADAGYRTEFFYPFWIAKAIDAATEAFIDILYNSGNGLCVAVHDCFTHSPPFPVNG
jgi:hypothetical protein